MQIRRRLWELRQKLRRGDLEWDGFLSYRDDPDGPLTKALQAELLHLGAPILWVIRRPLRVFLDRPNLTGPALWEKLAGAIDRSRWLIVVACPDSAASEWVGKEIGHFLQRDGEARKKVQIILTAGEIVWDDGAGDFDWSKSTAVPRALSGVFSEVPRWLDMTWTRGHTKFAKSDGRYRDQLKDLARTLRELKGFQQSEEERRLGQRRWIAAGVVAVLLAGATGSAVWERNKAQDERDRALSSQLLSEAKSMLAGTIPGGDVRAIQELLLSQEFADRRDDGVLLNALVDRRTTDQIIETPSAVNALAVSIDGHIASAGADSTVHIWNMADGKEVRALQGHQGEVLSVAFSPDGSTIATGGADNTVRLWDAATGVMRLPVMQADGPVASLAFRSDGRVLASAGSTSTVQLWDTVNRTSMNHDIHVVFDIFRTVAFGADGRVITGMNYGRVREWDPAGGRDISPIVMGQGDGQQVRALAVSPTSPWIAAGTDNGILRLWNSLTGEVPVDATGRRVYSLQPGHADVVSAVAFSPNGTRIASGGGDQTLRLWDKDKHMLIVAPMVGHHGAITAVTFAPDGRRIVSGSSDGTIRIWDPTPAIPLPAGTKSVVSVAYSRDGARIVTTSDDGTMRVWDGHAPHEPLTAPLDVPGVGVNSAAFSPDGTRILTGMSNNTLQWWNAESGELIGQPARTHANSVTRVAINPDGLVATAGGDGRVILWDAAMRSHVELTHGAREVLCVDFSRDGKRLAFGTADGLIEVWDVDRRERRTVLSGHRDKIRDIAFDRDGGRLASGSVDGTVRLWNIASGSEIGDPLVGHRGAVWDVAFSPDGRLLASSDRDTTIRLWNGVTGESIAIPLTGHERTVRSVAFSPDGAELASVSDDLTLRFWPVTASRDALCAKLTSNMSEADWQRWISPDIDYRKACPDLPVAGS